jgi:transketolase
VGSDGELQEGVVWEALMSAAKYRLEHFTYVIDRNHIQIGGYNEEVMPLEPLRDKLESMGMFVIEVDGHNIKSLIDVFSFDQSVQSRPVAIIAHTIPGKGVSFIEDKPEWHGKPAMGRGEAVEALRQLRTLQGKIEGGHID